MGAAKLKKLLLRYYPPGIILQYSINGCMKQKPIDLLDLNADTDLEVSESVLHVVSAVAMLKLVHAARVLVTSLVKLTGLDCR
jgi:dynein assembly factor with WDR repeat domains 1